MRLMFEPSDIIKSKKVSLEIGQELKNGDYFYYIKQDNKEIHSKKLTRQGIKSTTIAMSPTFIVMTGSPEYPGLWNSSVFISERIFLYGTLCAAHVSILFIPK